MKFPPGEHTVQVSLVSHRNVVHDPKTQTQARLGQTVSAEIGVYMQTGFGHDELVFEDQVLTSMSRVKCLTPTRS